MAQLTDRHVPVPRNISLIVGSAALGSRHIVEGLAGGFWTGSARKSSGCYVSSGRNRSENARHDGIGVGNAIKKSIGPDQPRPVLILMTCGMAREKSRQASSIFDAMLYKPVKVTSIEQTMEDVMTRNTRVVVNS